MTEPSDVAVAETAVLQAILDRDGSALTALLDEEFLITTAGWLAAPASRSEWVEEVFARHELHAFHIESIHERAIGDVRVAFVLSSQTVIWQGERQTFRFRYTDVWRRDAARWVLAARHASIVPTA